MRSATRGPTLPQFQVLNPDRTNIMPKPTKRDQLKEVQKLLAEAAFKLSAEGDNWEGGYRALQRARAIIAELNGDIEAARSAHNYVQHMERLDNAPRIPLSDIKHTGPL